MVTTEELVQKVEAIQALKFAAANYYFATSHDDSERFKKMFPGSEITKNYQQGLTKIKYKIKVRIA